MLTLKDALLKAGFKSNEKPKEKSKKRPNHNKRVRKDSGPKKTKHTHHHAHKNFCESCENIQPDVELYNHRNATVRARWICCTCADRHMIPDETRQTCQSESSLQGTFKRMFGRTKRHFS